MKRIDIFYGGRDYSVGNRTLEELQTEIAAIQNSSEPGWLTVNSSYGSFRESYIRITSSTDIALAPVGDDEE